MDVSWQRVKDSNPHIQSQSLLETIGPQWLQGFLVPFDDTLTVVFGHPLKFGKEWFIFQNMRRASYNYP